MKKVFAAFGLCLRKTYLPQVEWDLHHGAHLYWRNITYSRFGVNNINELLNIEPSIDHFETYKASIPEYFRSPITVDWIDNNFMEMEHNMQMDAKKIMCEAAAIMAADAMCHPRDRVGKFGWNDVVDLHSTLNTRYLKFILKHDLVEEPLFMKIPKKSM